MTEVLKKHVRLGDLLARYEILLKKARDLLYDASTTGGVAHVEQLINEHNNLFLALKKALNKRSSKEGGYHGIWLGWPDKMVLKGRLSGDDCFEDDPSTFPKVGEEVQIKTSETFEEDSGVDGLSGTIAAIDDDGNVTIQINSGHLVQVS